MYFQLFSKTLATHHTIKIQIRKYIILAIVKITAKTFFLNKHTKA